MLSQLVAIWFRTLTRYRLYTFINVAGLSLGVCAVIAIFMYINDELSYDKFQANNDRIYRITVTNMFSGNETRWPTTAAPIAEAIRNDLSSAEHVTRIYSRQASIQTGSDAQTGEKFREQHTWFADPDVFKVFTFNFIAGDPSTALKDPHQVVVSKSIAIKYFSDVSKALGKDILFEGTLPLTISAVYEDIPDQSYLEADIIAHFDNYYNLESPQIQEYLRSDWIYNPLQTFVLLKPGVSTTNFEKELLSLRDKYGDERVRKNATYQLQPFTDIRLHSTFTYESSTPAINNIYILASIGFIILLIACVNFINLANVQSLKRAREIGIRKVLGANKGGLASQFLLESGALVLIAFILGIACLYLVLPYINELAGKHFAAGSLLTWKVLGGIASLFVITAFLAGTYPSLYITRFNPVLVLKGLTGGPASEGYTLRKILMTMQFTISIILVVLSIVFWKQMEFVGNKPLGFQSNNILTIPLFSDTPNSIFGFGVDGPLRARMNGFENELTKNPGIEGVTASSLPPGLGASTNALVWTDKIKQEDNVLIATMAVDYDFIQTYKMEMIAGRPFSRDAGTDHLQAFVVNEQAAKKLGFENPSDAVGQRLGMLGKDGTIIGVVKDFHFMGLQNQLSPMSMEVAAGKFTVFSISMISGSNITTLLDHVRSEWNKAFPEKVFEYHFLDESLERNYGSEQRMVTMMQCFSMLAILISALGLFGLAAYINHQRSKEVSIRKILGANAAQVFTILSREFVKMTIIAFIIAVPFAWFLAGKWLDSFAYKSDLGWDAFFFGGIVAVVTVLLTISYETIKSLRINPAEKLRE
jgi:putative ABC transport system permease protein